MYPILASALLAIASAAPPPPTPEPSPQGAPSPEERLVPPSAGDPVEETAPAAAPAPTIEAAASRLPTADADAEGLEVAFGDGVELSRPGAPIQLTFRARVQLRGTARHTPSLSTPPDVLFQVRRARLVFNGQIPEEHLQFYIQLGVGPSDVEGDAPYPLRDWVLTWTRYPAAKLRMGQMKVPFTRERLNSSSALQLVDRSLVNEELNLDRDIGIQLFSNDLAGDGHLSYQIGVFNGDGRNRFNGGTGLLYAARVQFQPLGGFGDQLTQADLTRERKLRASFGAAVGYNDGARRSRSTHGELLEGRYDTSHASADMMLKWSGWSLQAEGAARWVRVDEAPPESIDEPSPTDGIGMIVQLGRTFANGTEVAGRTSYLTAPQNAARPAPTQRAATLALGHYLYNHDFKIQADVGTRLFGDRFADAIAEPTLEGRVQMQVYF